MGSKTKTKSTSNQTTTAAPPSWAEPTMIQLANQIMSGVNTVQGLPSYTGDFIAQPGDLQLAVPGAYTAAAQLAQSLVPQAQAAFDQAFTMPTFTMTPEQLQAATQSFGATNPEGMVGAVNAAIDPVYKQLTQQILPTLQSSGIESGAYGGSRAMTTLPQLALQDYDKNAANIAATMTYQDYVDAANRMLTAYQADTARGLGTANVLTDRLGLTPDMLDSIMRLSGGSAELQAQAASIDSLNRQSAIDNALQQYQYGVQQPFMGYDIATDLISRLANGYGTTTSQGTSTQTQSTGGLGQVLGGVLGAGMGLLSLPMAGGASLGGSLVSSLFGNRSSAGPALSDRRLKAKLSLIERAVDGLGLYSWNWTFASVPRRVVGVIADEVKALRPWALKPAALGPYDAVDYSLLGGLD